MSSRDCVFCRIVDGTIPAKVVFEDDTVLAFEDIKPQAPVHILVIPKQHIERVSDITGSNSRLVGALIMRANELARRFKVQDSGYRVVFNCNKDAGQEVFHMHLHLLGGRKFAWPPG